MELRSLAASELTVVVLAGVAATVLFRLGVLPGGMVGVDVLLAALGWWLASAGPGIGPLRRRTGEAWSYVWRPVVGAIVLAIAWVAAEESTRRDPLVRGEALAILGGYANWHQFALGPIEQASSRIAAPLQHGWALAVLVQCVLVWFLVVAATRGRAARRPDQRDPVVLVALVLAVIGLLVGVGLAASGASGQAIVLATPVRAVAFFLGVSAGAAGGGDWGAALRDKVLPARWLAVGGLVVAAVLGTPGSDLGRWAWAVMVPAFAAIAVISSIPWPPAAPSRSRSRAVVDDRGWAALVAAWILVPPSIALADAVLSDAPAVLVDVAGLVLAAAAVAVAVGVRSVASMDLAAVERRRVLVPPLVVALLVVLFSLTGAFHWEAPQSIEQYERSHR